MNLFNFWRKKPTPPKEQSSRVKVIFPGISNYLANDGLPVFFIDLREEGVVVHTRQFTIPIALLEKWDIKEHEAFLEEIYRLHKENVSGSDQAHSPLPHA